MQFELKDVVGVGTPKKSEDGTTRSLHVNITVGVVGMPADDKYKQFQAQFTEVFTWNVGQTDDAIEAAMEAFAAQYVADTYPDIV